MSTDLHLSPDVAGATFMATATCFPELFVNIIGTFVTETDLGVGAIVGSGVFNTLGVAACAGLAASKVRMILMIILKSITLRRLHFLNRQHGQP